MELSYLNLYDAEAAWQLVHDLAMPAGTGGSESEPAVAWTDSSGTCGPRSSGE